MWVGIRQSRAGAKRRRAGARTRGSQVVPSLPLPGIFLCVVCVCVENHRIPCLAVCSLTFCCCGIHLQKGLPAIICCCLLAGVGCCSCLCSRSGGEKMCRPRRGVFEELCVVSRLLSNVLVVVWRRVVCGVKGGVVVGVVVVVRCSVAAPIRLSEKKRKERCRSRRGARGGVVCVMSPTF